MREKLVADSSTLVALERADLIHNLNRISYDVISPKAVMEEVKSDKVFKLVKVQELKGRTLKISRNLERLNIGRGEAQCCALAFKLRLDFIVCDDRKFIRQIFFSENKKLQSIKVLGFSFFLHAFYREKLIGGIWDDFNKIIRLNNWERSEVLAANYTFLKELGY